MNDIGLVKGKFQKVSYLNIKPDGAELGEDIVAFGYPLSRFTSDSVKLTKGIVSSLSGPGNNFSQIQIDAAIQPGSSGGPLFNKSQYVIGITTASLAGSSDNINLAIPINYIQKALKISNNTTKC